MKLRETAPATGAAAKQASKNSISSSLSAYERRCVERLVRGCCERKILDYYVGTTNSPEYIRQLKAKGLKIICHKVKGLNRDGRKVWWGNYCLDSGSMAKAKALLGSE